MAVSDRPLQLRGKKMAVLIARSLTKTEMFLTLIFPTVI